MATPLVIAHRGWHAPGHAENSTAAVRAAFRLGCDAAEVDVRRTADGRLALVHDTNANGCAVTLSPVAALDRVSLLEDALLGTFEHRRQLVIDVKDPADEWFWELLHDELAYLREVERESVIVQTSQHDPAASLAAALPGVRISMLHRRPALERHRQDAGHWASSRIHFGLQSRRIWQDQNEGRMSLAWTVNRPNRMRTLIDAGINGLITDRPDLMLEMLVSGRPQDFSVARMAGAS